MKSLSFYTIKEKKPEDQQSIFYFDCRPFYGTISPAFGVVDYCWFEYDEDGETGSQIAYSKDEPTPDNYRLRLMIGGFTIGDEDNFWWTEAENVDQLVDGDEGEDTSSDLPYAHLQILRKAIEGGNTELG